MSAASVQRYCRGQVRRRPRHVMLRSPSTKHLGRGPCTNLGRPKRDPTTPDPSHTLRVTSASRYRPLQVVRPAHHEVKDIEACTSHAVWSSSRVVQRGISPRRRSDRLTLSGKTSTAPLHVSFLLLGMVGGFVPQPSRRHMKTAGAPAPQVPRRNPEACSQRQIRHRRSR